MKKLLFPITLFISFSVSAQRKKLEPFVVQIDTLHKEDGFIRDTVRPLGQQKNFYKMPTMKPSKGSEYSSLKDTRTDRTDYRMLNSIKPEERQKEKAGNLPKQEGR